MIYQIVAVKDRALNAFQEAFSTRAIGQAIRAFQDAINKPDNPMYNHADDYDLWHVGNFNDETGRIEAIEPQQIAIGKQLRFSTGITLKG